MPDLSQPPREQGPRRLARALGVAATVGITVSVIGPATSVFVVAPVAVTGAGTGAVWSYLMAGLAGFFLAFCYGELAAAYPLSGGEYVMVGRVLGPGAGFATMVLVALQLVVPAVLAQGAAGYLGVVIHGADTRYTAAALIVVAGLIATRKIKLNAAVTGTFLALELALLTCVTVLGFMHSHRSVSTFVHPQVVVGGDLHTAGFTAILTLAATGLFSFGGFQTPVYLAEENKGPSRNIARAILVSLAVAVVAETVPLASVLIGAPSLVGLSEADSPMSYFLSSVADPWFGDLVSFGVAIAIFNFLIAVIVFYARMLFSTGRDRAWPTPVSQALAWVHPRLATPLVATAVVTVVSAGCVFAPQDELIRIVGADIVFVYILIAFAALAGRLLHRTDRSPYRMPLWPAAPVLALVTLGYVIKTQTFANLAWPAGVVVVALPYYFLRLRSREDRWLLLDPDAAPPAAPLPGSQKHD